MIGDRYVSDGIEFEVVWGGGEGLVGPRDTLPPPTVTIVAPKRTYNKTGKHVGEFNKWHKRKDAFEHLEKELDNVVTLDQI